MNQTRGRSSFVVTAALLLCSWLIPAVVVADTASFAFSPSAPHEGETILARVTATLPWAHIHLTLSGPIYVEGTFQHIENNSDGTRTWNFAVPALPAGTYAVEFRAGDFATGLDDRKILVGSTTLVVTPVVTEPEHWATFSFTPSAPGASQPFTAEVTAGLPYGWVHLIFTGPIQEEGIYQAVTDNGNGTWTWRFTVDGLFAGTYAVDFRVGDPATGLDDRALLVGSTSLQVLHGDPPPPPPPTCPYSAIQTLAQGNGNSWRPDVTIVAGTSFNVATFLPDRRTRACCSILRVTRPDGSTISVAEGGSVRTTAPGSYIATSTCGSRTSTITIRAVQGKPHPQGPLCLDPEKRITLHVNYNIAAEPQSWTCDELEKILQGTRTTARKLHDNCSPSLTADSDAFRKAMDLSGTTLSVSRRQNPCGRNPQGMEYCETCESPFGVECTLGASMTPQTFVHELGHVFNMRNGANGLGSRSLFDRLQDPFLREFDGNGELVFGRNELKEFCRGARGWGSAGRIPGRLIPCAFQQHPPLDPDDARCRKTQTETLDTYIGETAADMFLNWVYGAFRNMDFADARECNAGVPQRFANVDAVRRDWMKQVISGVDGICAEKVNTRP